MSYTALGSWEKLADVMGKEIGLTVEPMARGRLWYRRALLCRDILNRGGDALRCFREAVAVDAHNVEAISPCWPPASSTTPSTPWRSSSTWSPAAS